MPKSLACDGLSQEEDIIPKNMRHPRLSPARLKHEKQVLRWYGFLKETVTESAEEKRRYRHVCIMYFMEDGTLTITDPKVETTGMPQGSFLKRQKVAKEDGSYLGPDDFHIGAEVTICGHTFHICGWFFEENGVAIEEARDRGGIPDAQPAAPPQEIRLVFRIYWDPQVSGRRFYFLLRYYLTDLTAEVLEDAACPWPNFKKRGALPKGDFVNGFAMMPSPHAPIYLPEDLKVGNYLNLWGKKVVIYDCDDFTQQHYLHLCGYNQRRSRTSFFDGDLFDVISDMSRPKAIGPKVLECAGVTG